ncbi:hypothetical protein FNV43_RR04637 [Rhamnella rubrinervis]|uniref:Uncharacterized protein n=1 Tax=Rhamnella rubrinervis TaxID=2594499 RepID=A0A8K0MQS9_9ROSA|nr:hypothetical protein FNV43_RR04637 [Rhamnella rubrinervis]
MPAWSTSSPRPTSPPGLGPTSPRLGPTSFGFGPTSSWLGVTSTWISPTSYGFVPISSQLGPTSSRHYPTSSGLVRPHPGLVRPRPGLVRSSSALVRPCPSLVRPPPCLVPPPLGLVQPLLGMVQRSMGLVRPPPGLVRPRPSLVRPSPGLSANAGLGPPPPRLGSPPLRLRPAFIRSWSTSSGFWSHLAPTLFDLVPAWFTSSMLVQSASLGSPSLAWFGTASLGPDLLLGSPPPGLGPPHPAWSHSSWFGLTRPSLVRLSRLVHLLRLVHLPMASSDLLWGWSDFLRAWVRPPSLGPPHPVLSDLPLGPTSSRLGLHLPPRVHLLSGLVHLARPEVRPHPPGSNLIRMVHPLPPRSPPLGLFTCLASVSCSSPGWSHLVPLGPTSPARGPTSGFRPPHSRHPPRPIGATSS